MNSPLTCFKLLLAAGFLACGLSAQSDSGGSGSGTDFISWEEVAASLTPLTPSWTTTTPTAAEAAAFRRQQADRFLAAADKAKSFAANHPGHARATEAKWVEAKALLQAAMAGDATQVEQANDLVQALRREEDLAAKIRLELVALADIVRLRPLTSDRVKFMAAQEQALRDLIAEFPGEPGGCERLLRFAENHYDDAAAVRIARDVAGMDVSIGINAAAEMILERHALVGQSLRGIASSALGADHPISVVQDRGVILYTWSATAAGSLKLGQDLARTAPTGTLLVGLNVDTDPAAAQAVAATEKLPGEQVYDTRGYETPFAQALKLRRLGEVYVADRQGILRSVSARRGDLTAKMSWAGR